MVRVIMGLKGSGKTKHLIELVNGAVAEEPGCVICLEHDRKLTYDISHRARLVNTREYGLSGFYELKGFLCGLYAGNFDISHIFIDSLYKVARSDSVQHAEGFLSWAEDFSNEHNVKMTITISADAALATEGIKKYF